MIEPSALIRADSIYPDGTRLTTMEVVMHRFVLAEFNTHRVFSRNSASSRAIPVSKQIKKISDNPAWPIKWTSEQPGMQGGIPLEGVDLDLAMEFWGFAQDAALASVESYLLILKEMYPNPEERKKHTLHKSLINRILEPYMWHTVIVTSTEWENFFKQRVSPLAQPEIEAPAEYMYEALQDSTPKILQPDEWHLPYIKDDDYTDSMNYADPLLTLIQVSAARCARVSYLTQDGIRDLSEDLKLFDRLVTADPPHYSPLEHVAMPNPENITWLDGEPLARLGNFPGWSQLRHVQKTLS
jgi:hypothetical protein